jgi:hypothetical protein
VKGRIFEDTAKIPVEMREMLVIIKKREFQRCFQKWESSWASCINSEVDKTEL